MSDGADEIAHKVRITRPFYLDPLRPDLATLYLQSSSGGIYAGEHLQLAIEVLDQAAVHVTTPAATLVHDSRGCAAALTTRLRVAANAFLAWLARSIK